MFLIWKANYFTMDILLSYGQPRFSGENYISMDPKIRIEIQPIEFVVQERNKVKGGHDN